MAVLWGKGKEQETNFGRLLDLMVLDWIKEVEKDIYEIENTPFSWYERRKRYEKIRKRQMDTRDLLSG